MYSKYLPAVGKITVFTAAISSSLCYVLCLKLSTVTMYQLIICLTQVSMSFLINLFLFSSQLFRMEIQISQIDFLKFHPQKEEISRWNTSKLSRCVRPQFAHSRHKFNVNLCESNFPESNENEEVEADLEGKTKTLRAALVLPYS